MLGSAIPAKVRDQILADPVRELCCLKDYHKCGGRITWEHALYYRGSKINEKFAIISLCAKYHSVDQFQDNGLLDKRTNQWVALNQMTEDDFKKYDRSDFKKQRDFLNKKFGEYKPPKVKRV